MWHLNETIEAAIRVWKGVVEYMPSILFGSSGFIEELADQKRAGTLQHAPAAFTLSHVTSSFTFHNEKINICRMRNNTGSINYVSATVKCSIITAAFNCTNVSLPFESHI